VDYQPMPEPLKDEDDAYRLFLAFALANAEQDQARVIELAEWVPQDRASLMLLVRAGMTMCLSFIEAITVLSRQIPGGRDVSAAQMLRELALDAAKPNPLGD
jgi:hypothetical protein